MLETQGAKNTNTRCHRQAEGRRLHLLYDQVASRWQEMGSGKTWGVGEHLPRDDSEWRPKRSGSPQMIVLIRSGASLWPSETHVFMRQSLFWEFLLFLNQTCPLGHGKPLRMGTRVHLVPHICCYLTKHPTLSRLHDPPNIPITPKIRSSKFYGHLVLLRMRRLPQLHHTWVKGSHARADIVSGHKCPAGSNLEDAHGCQQWEVSPSLIKKMAASAKNSTAVTGTPCFFKRHLKGVNPRSLPCRNLWE